MAEPPSRSTEADAHGVTAQADLGSDATLPSDSATAGPQLEPGATIGRFTVGEELGRGGMGVVVSAYDNSLEREVAIKLLPTRAHSKGERGLARARLLREAQAMAQLRHPNVVTVYEVGDFGDEVFIAMELVAGGTAKSWSKQATRSWRQVVELYTLAGRGLAKAHELGLVHRDFKPANVLVGEDGRVLVSDFGLVSAGSSSAEPASKLSAPLLDASLTRTGAIMGTPRYMAPEQRLGERTDARSDQFSFCVALFEALYGEHPFEGDRVTPPPAPTTSDAPPGLHKALLRGLALEPSRRFESLTELLEEINGEANDQRPGRQWLVAGIAGAVALLLAGVLLWRSSEDRLSFEVPQTRRADESQRTAVARSSFEMATDFFGRQQYRAAARAFEHAYQKRGFPQFMFNIGASWEKLREYCSAAVHFQQYLYDIPKARDRTDVQKRTDVLGRECAKRQPLGATLLAQRLIRDEPAEFIAHIADAAAVLEGHLLSLTLAYEAWTKVGSCSQRLHALARHQGYDTPKRIVETRKELKRSCKQKRDAPAWEFHLLGRPKEYSTAADLVVKSGPPAPLRSLLAAMLYDRADKCIQALTHYARFSRDYPHATGKKLVALRLDQLKSTCNTRR